MMVSPVFLNKCFVCFSFSSSLCLYFCVSFVCKLSPSWSPVVLLPSYFQCSGRSTALVCPEMTWHNENWVISHLSLAPKNVGTLDFRTWLQNIVLGSGGYSQKSWPTKTDQNRFSSLDHWHWDFGWPSAQCWAEKTTKSSSLPSSGAVQNTNPFQRVWELCAIEEGNIGCSWSKP